MALSSITTKSTIDVCRLCGENFNPKKTNKHNLIQGKDFVVKPEFTVALEELTGPMTVGEDLPMAVCTSCRTILSRYYRCAVEVQRLSRLVREMDSNIRRKRCAAFSPAQERGVVFHARKSPARRCIFDTEVDTTEESKLTQRTHNRGSFINIDTDGVPSKVPRNVNGVEGLRSTLPVDQKLNWTTVETEVSRELSEQYERLVNPEKAVEDSKPLKIKEEPMSDIAFPVSEEPEADLASGDQALPIDVLGAPSERLAAGLEGENSPHPSAGAAGNSSPLWHLAQVKMEPQDGEEGQVSGHGVLGGDVFEEGPMSTMSEAGMAPSPSGAASDASYASHSPDSLMGTSPVFNQRPRKRMKKI